jgi:CRISPR-associated protein (TIGR03986 family)
MAEGKVKWFDGRKGYGFIERDDGVDVFVHISEWRGPAGSKLRDGDRVTFEVEEAEKGPQAVNVRPAGQRPARRGGYRFLNPYNFVRYLSQSPASAVQKSAETRLLARCEPPPHDRYLVRTGRITCTVEAVTPLFVSDSHKIRPDEKHEDHKHYRFFQYDGQDAIPATSLRGAIRSVFEAVTNSCFLAFDPGRLDYREGFAPRGMTPARVIDLDPETGKAILEILDAARKLPQGIVLHYNPKTDRPLALINAAPVPAYPPKVLDTNTGRTFDPSLSEIPPEVGHSVRVAALLRKDLRNRRRYQHFIVDCIVLASDHESLREGDGHHKVFGYLHVTGPNIENKHDERLFFRWDDRHPDPPALKDIPKACVREVSVEVIEEYNQHLVKYRERNERQIRFLDEQNWPLTADALPHPSRFVRTGEQLKKGDLVYYIEGGLFDMPLLRPVNMPRMPHLKTRGELLPNHLHPCEEYTELCPACRVFGWVYGAHQEKQELPLEKVTAYAGRLHLSHARLIDGTAGTLDEVTLAILSSPKPTATLFYLLRGRPDEERGEPPEGDDRVGYRDGYKLRGRKVYRHNGEVNPQEYERATDAKHDGKDDQNRTVHGVRRPGNKFQFTIDFHNLAPMELGALLWALELEGKEVHRLGFAKPLGFGSVKIEVAALDLLEPGERYESLSATGGWRDGLAQKDGWVQAFQEAVQELYGQPFAQLSNVRDLLALLGEPPDLPIHYPRPPHKERGKWVTTPDPEGKNFEWFVGNKRKGGPRRALKLADEDTEGLPLLNKQGEPFGG